MEGHSNSVFPRKMRIDGNLRVDEKLGATVLTTNLSRVSVLADVYDLEAMNKGLASAKIHVRNKNFEFNHMDKLFDRRKPLDPIDYIKSDSCHD